jgi:dihydropteroate synthase
MAKNKINIMGTLNITPDSFSDGGEYYKNISKAVLRTKKMLDEGASFIDIGGESTRPGSEKISAGEELKRVIPVIKNIKKHIPNVKLSIDTWKHEVAKEALKNGCTVVNSLGGFLFDKKLAEIIAETKCSIIVYHIKGKPKTMQKGQINYTDVVKEISAFFGEQIEFGEKNGIKKDKFILDPGIGFGKTVEQNLEIIMRLKEFQKFKLPMAIGVSRKSHLGKILRKEIRLETSPTERLEASLAETAIAVQNGADIIRTHDILQTKKFLTVLEKFL